MKNLKLTFLIFLMATLFTGCLKTRTQLREERSDGASDSSSDDKNQAAYKPIPVQPAQEIPGQYALDEIKVTLTQLEGRVQDLERANQDNQVNAHSKKLEARIQQLDQTIATLTQSQSNLEQAQSTLTNSLKELENNPALSNPDETFKQAKSQFDKGDYTTAIDTFASYIKNPRAKKIEDAIFMRATSLYKLKQYKKAIVDFSKFPEKYPKSSKTPEAMYKIGLCFDALDMKEDARGFYQEIIEKYPKSAEAKKAKKKVK